MAPWQLMLTGTIWSRSCDDTKPPAHGLDSYPAGKTGLPGGWGEGGRVERHLSMGTGGPGGWRKALRGDTEDGEDGTHRQMECVKL
jgi:hypothetical protein